MKIRVLVATTLALASISLSASAQQQPWLKDRRYGEGIGIRTGDLELHPGVEGEVGYDSNYFQRSGDSSLNVYPEDRHVIPVYRFRLTPSFSLSTLSPRRRLEEGAGAAPKVNFRAGVSAGLNALTAANPSGTDALGNKDSDAVSNQNHVDLGANFNLDILPQAPFGMDAYGNYLRMIEPSNVADTRAAWDRDMLVLGTGVIWRPGGGLFDWRLGYEFRYNYFERAAFQEFNNVQHFIKTRGRWRFLPRTAFLYDASLGFINYPNPTTQHGSQPLRARLGLNGLVSNHFALLAMAGWGAGFYDGSADFDSLIAQAELKWYILPSPGLDQEETTVGLSSIAIGYIRDFRNSYLADFYQEDRGYLNFSYFVGGRVLLSLEGGISHNTYPDYITPTRNTGFSQNRVDATLFAEYRLSDTFGINTTLRYTSALENHLVQIGGTHDDLHFSRFEAYLGARWFM